MSGATAARVGPGVILAGPDWLSREDLVNLEGLARRMQTGGVVVQCMATPDGTVNVLAIETRSGWVPVAVLTPADACAQFAAVAIPGRTFPLVPVSGGCN